MKLGKSATRLAQAALLIACSATVAAAQGAGAGVLVASRELPRGHVLEASDIAYAESRSRERAAEVTAGQLPEPGWITRRVVREGEILRVPTVVPPSLVARGDTVRVHWRVSGIEISRPGIALGEAALGELVQVRLGALQRVSAVATGPSTVLVQ
ncbi:MAG TPA: flagellar basal body P-ring formation chaperone FlgA [Gemmatimonadales bacterium]|nr:flagellar basal body P-ring formation chaperone FlgA [Gemmatimonadales bacterium]